MTHQMIDPEELTPASKRALRSILIGFTVFVLFLTAATGVIFKQLTETSACNAKQFSWNFAHDISIRLTIPLPTDGFTGETLRSRASANELRVENRKVLLATLGDRPSC